MRRVRDSVTDNFLLKIFATPSRAVALRLSHSYSSRNDVRLGRHLAVLAYHCGG